MVDTEDTLTPASTGPAADMVKTAVVGTVSTEHDIEMSTSCAGVVNAQGDASVTQGGAGVIIAHGDVQAHQTGAAALFASSVTGDHVYNCVTVASDVSASRSWIGIALSPKMRVSDDSRVIVGPVAALIIAVAALGIFGIVAAFGVIAARRALAWRPRVPQVSWHRMGE